MSNQLCSGQDMLPERIIKIIVFIGDVQRMTGQVAQRDDFIAAFQQQFRDAHVQDGVGNAVVAGDEHQHFIVRSQGRQQSFALFFHGGGMAAHRHGTTEQSLAQNGFGIPKILLSPSIADAIASCPKSRSNTGLSRVMPLLSMSRALAMDAAAVCI